MCRRGEGLKTGVLREKAGVDIVDRRKDFVDRKREVEKDGDAES